MDYKYYKDKYKSFTVKLDRIADADLIEFLTTWPKGPKHAIVLSLRIFKKAIKGGLSK